MPRAQHSSSDDDDNSSDASSANLSWPLPTYHRGFPCVRLPFNKSVFVKTVKAANKRSLSATFYFEGVDEERLLEIASSLFPFPGQPVRFCKGDPFNKVVVRSMTYFADSTQSHAFYLLLTTDGLPHAISKFLAMAGKLRAKELLPKADFDKDTKLHAYFARLLLFHSVTERDLDASELRMKVLPLSLYVASSRLRTHAAARRRRLGSSAAWGTRRISGPSSRAPPTPRSARRAASTATPPPGSAPLLLLGGRRRRSRGASALLGGRRRRSRGPGVLLLGRRRRRSAAPP
jgi:hypothetical protein